MDKYQVVFLLVVYYLVIAITTAVFSTGEVAVLTARGVSGWGVMNVILGSLVLNIPLVPVALRLIVALPFWVLLGYFVYLNIPLPMLNRAA